MESKEYQPNFSDPRIVKKSMEVISWCELNLSVERKLRKSHRTLREIFGPTGNKLSKWLRDNLIIQSGYFEKGGQCYEYILRKGGIEEIKKLIKDNFKPGEEKQKSRRIKKTLLLDDNNDVVVDENNVKFLTQKLREQIKKLEFEYNSKGWRDYNPLQNIKRVNKQKFWSDKLPHDYDISAAAPTILLQYSERLGLISIVNSSLRDYLDNKNEYREHVRSLIEIEGEEGIQIAKKILNGLFNGAILSKNESYPCQIYLLVNMDNKKMDRLINDKKIRHLRANIGYIWRQLKRKHFKLEKGRIKSGEKWNLYFMLEFNIMKEVYSYLDNKKIKYFKEHDGFRTNKKVNINEIEKLIEDRTAFILKLSGE